MSEAWSVRSPPSTPSRRSTKSLVGLRVAEMRVQDFRVLRDVWLPLAETILLIGENNTGKTSLLAALDAAFSSRCTVDDLFVDQDGTRADSAVVDILVLPASGEEFTDDLSGLLGSAVQIPADGPQFVGIRATLTAEAAEGAVGVQRRFLQGWARDREAASRLTTLPNLPSREVLGLLRFSLLDARRDLVEDLRQRRSYWGRLAVGLDLDPGLRATLESQLDDLGRRIVNDSAVLRAVQDELGRIVESMPSGVASVRVAPIPSRLDQLVSSMDVVVQAPHSAGIPMNRQGMGSRSLAALMVFKAFVDRATSTDAETSPMAITAFEEPEAHLHPQAQRSVYRLIESMPGQKIASTHSPYIAAIADLRDLRAFVRQGPEVRVTWIGKEPKAGTASFDEPGLEKVRRLVIRRDGDLLFARLVILVEGEAEEASLPVFADALWGESPDRRGVSVINVSGAPNFPNFVPILEQLGLPWMILADGDAAGRKGVADAGTALGRSLDHASDEVVMLPQEGAGQDFEAFLLGEGFRPELETALGTVLGATGVQDARTSLHGQLRKGGTVRDYQSPGWEERLVHDLLDAHKAAYGRPFAEACCPESPPAALKLPTRYRQLLNRADARLTGVAS